MNNIETMKLALDAFGEIAWSNETEWQRDRAKQAITALRQAIEQAQQAEPVAYDKTELNCFAQDLYDQKMREGKRGHYESMFHVIHQCVKRVAPPPRQPLTDEEIAEFAERMEASDPTDSFWREFARAIEAAHGIKENT